MKKLISVLSFVLPLISFPALAQSDLDQQRIRLIVNAFNEKSEQLIEPLSLADVKVRNGVGRADVNKKAKFSYFVQTENSQDPQSKIILIPMATSRFTPTYYQTDEWWDAHKNENPMPRQPMDEVSGWLKEMKLTSNPDVLIIDPENEKTIRRPLQEFLLEHYIKKHSKNGKITVYRGAERAGEADQWNSGQRPKSVRYWTPTANYAWRYARKNLNFVEELVAGKAPLLKFEIPENDFKEMVLRRWPRLTLGTELTKKAHDSFDSSGVFKDHLASGADFLGEGTFGVEFEIRSNKSGADDMLKYYKGTIGIAELAADRIRVIQQATARSIQQRPQEKVQLSKLADQRIENIKAEAQLLLLIQNKGSLKEIQEAASLVSRPEMTNIDGFSLSAYVRKAIATGGFDQKYDVQTILRKHLQVSVKCGALH